MRFVYCCCSDDLDPDAPLFSLDGRTVKRARIASVYDGDSVDVVFRLRPGDKEAVRFKTRLAGIDTPEIRTKNKAEKKLGYKARDTLREWCLGKYVTLQCGKFDKYGRLLVTIIHRGVSLNQKLVDEKLAVVYDGGTKAKDIVSLLTGGPSGK